MAECVQELLGALRGRELRHFAVVAVTADHLQARRGAVILATLAAQVLVDEVDALLVGELRVGEHKRVVVGLQFFQACSDAKPAGVVAALAIVVVAVLVAAVGFGGPRVAAVAVRR